VNICLASREYPSETGWGGIGNYTYELAHGLAEKGHCVHVIALSLDHDKEYKDGKVHIHRIAHRNIVFPKRFFLEFFVRLEYSYRLFRKLKDVIKDHHIDVVEIPNFFAEGFVFSLFKSIPLVIRIHSSFLDVVKAYGWKNTFDRFLSCWMEDSTAARSDLVTSSTMICSQMMTKRLCLGPKKIVVIPLGIQIPAGESLNISREADSGLAPEVFFLGRLERRKGAHILMRAIPEVLKEIPDVHFTFAGRDTFVNAKYSAFEGPQQESFQGSLLKDFPEQYKKNVDFLGFVEKELLPGHFRKCDVFVAPSLYESFGLVYIEAMAYGKPVIGCGVGGVPEVVKDGITGLLVPPEDYQRLAEAILRLLKEPALRRELGEKAKQYVQDHFSRDLMVEKTLDAYRRVLKKK